jgi:2-iminobutanoate/2-iminopropanoate deaminase
MDNQATSLGTSDQRRISRRTIYSHAAKASLILPAAGVLGAAGVAAQATPQTGSDRSAINPGENFSGAIVANGVVYTSGMLAIDPETGELIDGDITAQTEMVLANLERTLTAAGSSMDRVVKATCFLANFDDFQAFNEAYRQAFTSEPPARSTVEVSGLALGALVEIDFIAVI